MTDHVKSRCLKIDRKKDLEMRLSKVIKLRERPKLDTLQTHCHVERILFFSFSGTVLSDMKNKRTIASKLGSELLIKLMISMSIATSVPKEPVADPVVDQPEGLDEYDVSLKSVQLPTKERLNFNHN